MNENSDKDDPIQEHLLMIAHSFGAGGTAFACLASIARTQFDWRFPLAWDFVWATVGFLICWIVLLRARCRAKTKSPESTLN
jgi:hypothetical protein